MVFYLYSVQIPVFIGVNPLMLGDLLLDLLLFDYILVNYSFK